MHRHLRDTRAEDYLPQNPFFVVQRTGPLRPDLRERALDELMGVLARHRHPDDDALLASHLGGRRSLPLQGWGTLFLRRAYADLLARDRPPGVDAVVDRSSGSTWSSAASGGTASAGERPASCTCASSWPRSWTASRRALRATTWSTWCRCCAAR